MKQFLASCIVERVPEGLSVIYDLDNLSIIFKTLVHFIIGIIVYLILNINKLNLNSLSFERLFFYK
ncbi:DUF3021 domain-containing protein [Clostridium perfringens]|nr:DUF3021 domain-containing protein [Clostridium perfringens]